MKIDSTPIQGLWIIEYNSFKDNRGEFVKTIHHGEFAAAGLDADFKESYFSMSKKDVIRGMHFQLPPHEHSKLIYAVTGAILDVVLDLRKTSTTYGQFFATELSAANRKALYIGKGLAHGFCVLEADSIAEYHVGTVQERTAESGIRYDSFGFSWPATHPILSERDKGLTLFEAFSSPW